VLILLAIALGVGGWFILDSSPDAPAVAPLGSTLSGPIVEREPSLSKPKVSTARLPEPRAGDSIGSELNNVLWPLEVELDLLEAGDIPQEKGVASLGSGAVAILRGRVGGSQDSGVMATVTFVEGPNEGRVLRTDVDGKFGATNLLPGLAIVEITGDGLVGARREVRLRQRRETLLNIGFGRLGTLQGQVLDKGGDPLEGVRVQVDLGSVYTDEEGHFWLPNLASGLSFVELSKEGFAAYRENVNITANHVVNSNQLKYVMAPGATLNLDLKGVVGGPGPALVYLSSGNPKGSRTFPFYTINPVEVFPGGVTAISNLPRELISVRVFRPGAECTTPMRNINLQAGQERTLEMELRSTMKLTGVVMADGAPAAGVQVTLEAPNQVEATLGYYRQPSNYLESDVMSPIPAAFQTVVTGGNGRFTLTAWSDISASRYLKAVSSNGELTAIKIVHAKDEEVQLDLEPRSQGAGILSFELTDRFQGLPIAWRVNGEPMPPFVLGPSDDLKFEGLAPGRWGARARWDHWELMESSDFEIRDGESATGFIELPEDAVIGQGPEAWLRAGKEYPL
jgi:hypothetical protein